MKVYVVLVFDHRADVSVDLFTSQEAALAFAEQEARSLSVYGERIRRKVYPGYGIAFEMPDGEGDHAVVMERDIHE